MPPESRISDKGKLDDLTALSLKICLLKGYMVQLNKFVLHVLLLLLVLFGNLETRVHNFSLMQSVRLQIRLYFTNGGFLFL